MKSGLKPIKKDHRDYSFHRTFGSITSEQFPETFNTDARLTNPNQNADGLPYGCTGYTQSELCQDEDKVVYSPRFTYDAALTMEGQPEGVGCDIRDSLKSTIVYGVWTPGEPKDEAINHRRGAYYNVEKSHGDWFDSIRSTIQLNKRSVSVGSYWYPSFMDTDQYGIVKAPHSYDPMFAALHNYKIAGWDTINGIPYLKAKAWIGRIVYFPREIINQILDNPNAGAFTLTPFNPQDTQQVVLTLYQTVISYLRMWLKQLQA